jgi:thermitase
VTRSFLLLLLGVLILGTARRAGSQVPANAVPGEVLVGIRAEAVRVWSTSAGAPGIGRVAGYQPALQAYRVALQPGVSLAAAIELLRARPEVRYAEPNYLLRAAAIPNDPYFRAPQWAPEKVQADLAWDIWRPRAPVTLALVDTGVNYTHPELAPVLLRSGSAVLGHNTLANTDDARDDNGHGSHCAGIAAARINNRTGIAGIAGWTPAVSTSGNFVQVLPVKALDATGWGTQASVADGIVWAADHGARVINLSVGGSETSETLQNAVQYAWGKGCVLAAAAGSDGTADILYPAGYEHVLPVAATDARDTLASVSNYGPWIPVAAPGVNIFSTWLGTGYVSNSGTSMATPHVAAEAAAILAQNPSLANSQVAALITANVDPYTPDGNRSLAPGAGRINVYRALLAAGGAGPPPPPVAPTGLAAAAGVRRVNLSWTQSRSPGVTGDRIYRAAGSGSLARLATLPASTTYADTSVRTGIRYTYRVSALNSAGKESGLSTPAVAVPR